MTSNMPFNPLSSPRRWQIGPGLIFLAGAGGLLLLLMLFVFGAWIGNRRRLSAEFARIRAAGEPVSVEDVEAFYRAPPAGRDCTQLWLTALATLDTPQFKVDAKGVPFVGEDDLTPFIPTPGEPWPKLESAERLLAAYRASLDQLHQAAHEGGRARFPTRFADGIMMLLPHAQQLQPASRLLSLESVVAVHRGSPQAAAESILTLFAAARSLEQEPVLLSQLVRMAHDGMARERLIWLLSAAALDDAQLARLDAALSACDYQQGFHRGLLGERAIGIQAFANPATLGGETPDVGWALTRASDEIVYLQLMREMIAAADKTGPARKQAVEQVESQLSQLAGGPLSRFVSPLTLLLMPALGAYEQSAARKEAERDTARAAVAIERFHRVSGRLPRTLEELTPKFLGTRMIDPFNGAPLHYRIDATHYLVYSVGMNGLDDGGASDPPDRPADLVVRVRRKDVAAGN